MVTGFQGWASQESHAEAILPVMTQLGSPQHNTQHDIHLSSFCWGSHQVLPWFKRKEMDLHPLMGSGKVLEQQCGARNTAVATFGNYHLLQLELKTFFTRKKKWGGCEKRELKQLTNHTWRLSMPAPISLPLGNLQSVLTENWTGIKHFNSTWLKLLLNISFNCLVWCVGKYVYRIYP